jgi:uncharacterized protein YukE
VGGNGGGQPPPEQKTSLGFPMRPAGDGDTVKAGCHSWYELAGEISGAFTDLDRAISGMRWSGDARKAFDAVWLQFSRHGTEASQYAQEMGDNHIKLGNQIEDAQHEWDVAMAAMAASTAVGIGLTFVTFGISDAVAEGAATAAVGTMETVCAEFDIALDAAVQALMDAMRVAVQLAVKFTLQFAINVVSQETSNVVDGRSLGNVDLRQAAGSAIGAATVSGGVGGARMSAVVGGEGESVIGGEDEAVVEMAQGQAETTLARLGQHKAGSEVDHLPNVERADVDVTKFSDYSMNESHPANGGKWVAWNDVGYSIDSASGRAAAAQDVMRQLDAQLPETTATFSKTTEWGSRFQVRTTIAGPNGRMGTLVTVWQYDKGSDIPKLITNWLETHS